MTTAQYGYTRKLTGVSYEEALQQVTEALQKEGFGVLTEIDVKATLKKKLDVDFRQYRILGACNPKFAHKAFSAELLIGLLMPCNVVVMQEDDDTITVSAVNPAEMFKIVDRPDVAPLADEVGGMLTKAIEQL